MQMAPAVILRIASDRPINAINDGQTLISAGWQESFTVTMQGVAVNEINVWEGNESVNMRFG